MRIDVTKETASRFFLPAAIVGAAIAVAGAVLFFAWEADASFLPTLAKLRVASVTADDHAGKVLNALKEQIGSEHAHMQVSVIETPSVWASAQALKQQAADLAVARKDDPAAAEGRSIFVLRSIALAVLAPAGGADSIAKLKGKRIGILADDIDPMIKVVLDFYGISEKQIVRLDLKGLPAALRNKQVSAVAVVGPMGVGPIADTIEAIRTATKKLPTFLEIPEASAIVGRFAVYEEAEISAGAFGGSPVVPSEKIGTLSTNILLVSRASLSRHAAGELTRLLLAAKTRMIASWPDAGQLGVPSAEKDALLPAHPGTVTFLNGEETDLLDKSTNMILLCSMFTGFAGWLATGLNAMRNKRKGQELKRRFGRLPLLLANASNARQLGAIEKELSGLSEWLLQSFLVNEISATDFQDAQARVAHFGALIQKKRRSASLHHVERFFEQWQSSIVPGAAR